MNMSFLDLVNQYNDNTFDPEEYFGDLELFFALLKRRNLISEIDIENISDQNKFLIWLHQNDRKKFLDFVSDKLTDLYVDENNKVYLDLSDVSDLSELFCGQSRNGLSRGYIESVLNGEATDDWFDNTTYDVFEDVINQLNGKNLEYLGDYIVENLKGLKIDTETELLSDIANQQGHPDYVIVDKSVVQEIIKDEETMNYLLDENLDFLKSNLLSLHSNAYSESFQSEVYDDIFDELQEYVDGKGEFYNIPHRFKKETMTQRFRIPVAANFDQIILDYLDSGKNRGSRGLLEYHGDYIRLLEDEFNCLSVFPPDYPDYTKVKNYINEFFRDFV